MTTIALTCHHNPFQSVAGTNNKLNSSSRTVFLETPLSGFELAPQVFAQDPAPTPKVLTPALFLPFHDNLFY